MTLCTWCGQQSQSDIICDWCKRPLPTRTATGGRPEIEFLRDGDDDRPNYLGFGIVAACVAVIGILLFFMLRGAGASASSSSGVPNPRPSAPATNTSPQRVPQPVSVSSGRGPVGNTADGLPARTPGGTPLGGGGNNPPPSGPAARASGNIPINANIPRLVTIQKATFSLVNLSGGSKQLVGKLEMKNGSSLNVIDYRIELVWGTQIYSVKPVEGRGNNLRTLEQRVMRPRNDGSAQVMSQVINKPPDGSPYSIRLQAWLDGDPGMSVDEYLIR